MAKQRRLVHQNVKPLAWRPAYCNKALETTYNSQWQGIVVGHSWSPSPKKLERKALMKRVFWHSLFRGRGVNYGLNPKKSSVPTSSSPVGMNKRPSNSAPAKPGPSGSVCVHLLNSGCAWQRCFVTWHGLTGLSKKLQHQLEFLASRMHLELSA